MVAGVLTTTPCSRSRKDYQSVTEIRIWDLKQLLSGRTCPSFLRTNPRLDISCDHLRQMYVDVFSEEGLMVRWESFRDSLVVRSGPYSRDGVRTGLPYSFVWLPHSHRKDSRAWTIYYLKSELLRRRTEVQVPRETLQSLQSIRDGEEGWTYKLLFGQPERLLIFPLWRLLSHSGRVWGWGRSSNGNLGGRGQTSEDPTTKERDKCLWLVKGTLTCWIIRRF